jgi:hypothetical protein
LFSIKLGEALVILRTNLINCRFIFHSKELHALGIASGLAGFGDELCYRTLTISARHHRLIGCLLRFAA